MGHLISADGIRPLKDKLDSIRDMPTPCNSKEVKQFLGLIGYYRKFVPCFAGAWAKPNGTCKNSYLPNGVTKAVLARESLP